MAKRASFSAVSGTQTSTPAPVKSDTDVPAARSIPVLEVVVEEPEPDAPQARESQIEDQVGVSDVPEMTSQTSIDASEKPEELVELDAEEAERTEPSTPPLMHEVGHHAVSDIPRSIDSSPMTQRKEVEIADLFHKVDTDSPEQFSDSEASQHEEESAFPEITLTENEGMKPGVFWAIAIVVATLIIGGSLIAVQRGALGRSVIPMLAKPTPTSVPSPTVHVIPTPTLPVISKKDIKISVLNGGGVKGAAGDMKKLLETKGYTVVSTGNTPDFTYDKTVLSVKAGKNDLLTVLSADVGSEYPLGTTSATLVKSSAFDAQVIVGKK